MSSTTSAPFSSRRKLPPLRFTLNPLAIVTNRRVYIQNLANLLHLAVLKEDWGRAYRAWAILIRCQEVDPVSIWQTGYLLLSHTQDVDPSGKRVVVPETPEDTADKRQRFLRRLLTSVQKNRRTEILHALVLHFVELEQWEEGMQVLELYLPSHPYTSSSPLHLYAGLLSYYLSLPPSFRPVTPASTPDPHPINRDHPLLAGKDLPDTVLEALRKHGIPESLRSNLDPQTRTNEDRQSSAAPSETDTAASSSQASSVRQPIHSMESQMDRHHLRSALSYFQKSIALDIARDKIYKSNAQQVYRGSGGVAKGKWKGSGKGKGKGVELDGMEVDEEVRDIEVDMRDLGTQENAEGKEKGSALAEYYVQKIKAIFAGANVEVDDDIYNHDQASSHDGPSESLQDSQHPDDDIDGQDDESLVPSDSDEEEDAKGFVVEYDQDGIPFVRQQQQRRSEAMDVDEEEEKEEDSKDDEEEDGRSEYSDLSVG